jgi:hypothetical protein
LNECGFEIGFRVLVLKVEELQYERIFDSLFWGHGIARLGNLPFLKQCGLILRESNPFIELAPDLTVKLPNRPARPQRFGFVEGACARILDGKQTNVGRPGQWKLCGQFG